MLILYLPDSEHSVPPLLSPWLVVYIYTGGSGTRFSPEKYKKYIFNILLTVLRDISI